MVSPGRPGVLSSFFFAIAASVFSYAASDELTQKPSNHLALGPTNSVSVLRFRSILELLPAGEALLANGKKVDRADWSSIVVAEFSSRGSYPNFCTATLVGPRVLLTAAHCIENDERKVLPGVINIAGKQVTVTCTLHPDYAKSQSRRLPRHDADYALCWLSDSLLDTPYETLSLNSEVAVGDRIVLTGFGCINLRIDEKGDLGYDKSYGILRMGQDNVEKVNTTTAGWKAGLVFYTLSPANSEATICPGDSGGPSFTRSNNKRVIIGVNSAVAWEGTGKSADFFSVLAPTGHSSFREFLASWKKTKKQALVCGDDLQAGTGGCR